MKILYLLFISCILFCSCKKNVLPPEGIVAKVGDEIITVDELREEYLIRNPDGSSQLTPKDVLEIIISREASVEKAKKNGFDKSPEMVRLIKQFIATKYMEYLKTNNLPSHGVTKDAVEGYYVLNQKEFIKPEAINIAIIQMEFPGKATEEKRNEILKKANLIREEALKDTTNAHFGDLSKQYSMHQASRYMGGELGWMTRNEALSKLPKEVVNAAFALNKRASISELIQTSEGLYLVKLMGKRNATIRPLDEVRGLIEYKLLKKREMENDRKLKELIYSGLEIKVYDRELEKIKPKETHNLRPPTLPSK